MGTLVNDYPSRNAPSEPGPNLLKLLQDPSEIKNIITALQRDVAPESSLEQARYGLVLDASQHDDLFFVALHQLFCTWTAVPKEARDICTEPNYDMEFKYDISLVESAFGTLGLLLKNNSMLREHHLRQLAAFPAPLIDLLGPLATHRVIYRDTMKRVLEFLVRLSWYWSTSTYEHCRDGYPLLMRDLLQLFELHSPVLQLTIFRASWRNIGVKDISIGAQMEAMFKLDQQAHRENPGAAMSEAYNNELILEYRKLVIEDRRRQAPRPPRQNPPSIASGLRSKPASLGQPWTSLKPLASTHATTTSFSTLATALHDTVSHQ